MMRLLTLLLLCLATGIGVLLTRHPAPDVELVDYFPEDTLVFMEWDHGARFAAGQWRLGQAGKTIVPATWRQFLLRMRERDSLIAEMCRLVIAGEEFASRPAVSSLLTHGAAFALLPEHAGQSDFFPFRQWLIAVRVDSDVSEQRFEEVFGPIRLRQNIDYQGEVLARLVDESGQDFFYWRHHNVALVACEQALIRRSIDQNLQRMIRKTATLSMNSAYLRLRRLVDDRTDIFCYIDFDGLRRRIPLMREIDTAGGGLLPRHIAFCHRAAEGANRLEVGVLVNQESASAFITRHRLPLPVRQPFKEALPRETIFALWTNWFKAKYLWDCIRQQAGDDVAGLLSTVGQQVSDATGKSLDNFFDVFGGEFGVMITEQPVAHQSSRFLGGLLVAVHDRPAVAAMVEQMVAGLQVIAVQSGNLEIASVMLAGGLLQPAYILLSQHLILADSVELVEVVRRQLMHDGADGSEDGVPEQADRQGNVAIFLKVGEVVERLTPLLILLAKETNEWNRMLSLEARYFVREIGLPLLAALRDVSTGRLRGYVDGDAIFMELEYTLSTSKQ